MSESNTAKSNDEMIAKSDMEQILLEPYEYLAQSFSKDVTVKIAQAFNHWFNIPEEKLTIIKRAIKRVQYLSLLIDDIEDNSYLRKGKPVAHHVYGLSHTLNTTNLVIGHLLQDFLALDHPQVPQIVTERLLEAIRGQGMDIYWREALVCPTIEEYELMAAGKTGAFCSLILELMELFSEKKWDLKPVASQIGQYFQILDDLANLYSRVMEKGKGFADDLSEGKFSFPVVYGIRSRPDNDLIMKTLKQRPTDYETKKQCVDYMESIGCFSYTQHYLAELEKRICQEISSFDPKSPVMEVLQNFKKFYEV